MEPYYPFQDNYFDNNRDSVISDEEFEVVDETPYSRTSRRGGHIQALSKNINFPLDLSSGKEVIEPFCSSTYIRTSFPLINNSRPANVGHFYSHSCPANLNNNNSLDMDSEVNNSSLLHSSLPRTDFPPIYIPSNSPSQLSASEESSSNGDREAISPSLDSQFNSSRKHSLKSTESWNELTRSELKYQYEGRSHEGAMLRHIAISELMTSATPSNCITILFIGEAHSLEDIETIGLKLASSVGDTDKKESYFESLSKNSSEIDRRPLVRLCSLTNVSFSTVLKKLSALQELRYQGEEAPIVDLCICIVKPEKIIRLDVEYLKKISESVNILPLVSKGTQIVDDMFGTLLAERLATSNVSYYTLSLGTGTIEIDCESKNLDPSYILPCITYQKLLEFPKFQMMFAWPGLRSSALQKIKTHPVVITQPSSRMALKFLLSLTIFVAILAIYFNRQKVLFDEDHYNEDVTYYHNLILTDDSLSK